MPWYRGRARGGPYNTKHLIHPETTMRMAVDAADHTRALPAQRASTLAQPCVFGTYRFFEVLSEWHWDESSLSETW